VNYIRQYLTPELKYPTEDEINELQLIGYTWGIGDRYWKLAHKYYGDATLWWIIAHYNLKMEMDLHLGDVIYIPLPLEKIMRFIGV
jgi:hypothetical protein